MRRTLPLLALAAALVAATTAFGDAKGDKALAQAVAKGKELWSKPFGDGKACVTCHANGPNKMTAMRLHSYPKYNKALDKVVSAQQMMNTMIVGQGKGTALELGSEDLNSLEAYIATLK
jgi:cytochrome c